MKNTSITTFVHISFLLAFVVMITAFVLFIQYDKKHFSLEQKKRYQLIANGFLSGFQFFPSQKDLEQFYEKYKVTPVKQRELKLAILNHAETIYFKESFSSRIRVFLHRGNYYIYIQEVGYNLMLKDRKPKSYNMQIAYGLFFALVGIFLLLYIAILRKFMPLKELHKKIERVGAGQTQLQLALEGGDEIAKISQSFEKAMQNINSLITSKNLFMQNFMHELKTPIAKGKIAVAMLKPSRDKELLERVFDRMDRIIKEIATLEKAKTARLQPVKLYFNDVLEHARELLLESGECTVESEDFILQGDRELLAIVLKNLLDNAIKHGSDVSIRAKGGRVEICSKGEKLQEELSYYTEAFVKDRNSKGLGLGLYLSDTILKLHGSALSYRYKEGKNCFYFTLPSA